MNNLKKILIIAAFLSSCQMIKSAAAADIQISADDYEARIEEIIKKLELTLDPGISTETKIRSVAQRMPQKINASLPLEQLLAAMESFLNLTVRLTVNQRLDFLKEDCIENRTQLLLLNHLVQQLKQELINERFASLELARKNEAQLEQFKTDMRAIEKRILFIVGVYLQQILNPNPTVPRPAEL